MSDTSIRKEPSLYALLWDFIENGESSYGLSFSDLRERVRQAIATDDAALDAVSAVFATPEED